MNSIRVVFAGWLALTMALPMREAQSTTIELVPVTNPGNKGELSGVGAGGYGADAIVGEVDYDYFIGRYEVTNGQYAEFLNWKAKSDPLGLFSERMASNARGGIMRTGVDGSFAYVAKPLMADRPVNFVSFFDAVRFINWLHNGQSMGDTEAGAYDVRQGKVLTRSPNAQWFLPTEDEWYKSAYYDPSLHEGLGGYYDFATQSDSTPIAAQVNEQGVLVNPGPNVVNYLRGADWNQQDGHLTVVGDAGQFATSHYGTSDQSGNLWEWNETRVGDSARSIRGGSWDDVASSLAANARLSYSVLEDGERFLGFRVASRQSAPPLVGDFSGDGRLDTHDIDQLTREVQAGTQSARFDLTGDQKVDLADREFWLFQLKLTYQGDANLDGQFTSTDLVSIFQGGRYEDNQPTPARWADGDFDGDQRVGTADLVTALRDGGYELKPRSAGDFDRNGKFESADIDLLTQELRRGSVEDRFDLNDDGLVDASDRYVWISMMARVYVGDSNLNGVFESSDLVLAFQTGQYEDDVPSNSVWSGGDWNGDADFSSADLVVAFQDGGYETELRPAIAVVPEPIAFGAWWAAALPLLYRRPRNSSLTQRS